MRTANCEIVKIDLSIDRRCWNVGYEIDLNIDHRLDVDCAIDFLVPVLPPISDSPRQM